MTAALVLCFAMLMDAVFGEPDWLWNRLRHPAVLFGDFVGFLDRRMNKGTNRRQSGVVAVVFLLLGAIALGSILDQIGPLAEILCAAILLAQRSLVQHVSDVATSLRSSLAEARSSVALIVSRDCSEMTEPEVARAAIESASENLSDGVVAPAFWFLVGGLPGLFVYKVVNTADSIVGYRNARYEEFGWAAARLDDLLNVIPARATGFMIALLGGQMPRWNEITTDARRHKSPNAGWPEAAMARALDIALAGPRSYHGEKKDLSWVNGTANRDIGPAEIERSVTMLWQVWALMFGLVLTTAAIQLLL
ncbi:adenosylcobinamide-phosphate synthase CbiB [Primorskyibacter sp. S87]|uniref:adenosylcobinamide-phosphate synthase CbiB n=1 Tax=Primorskyibacter sp. S87 TaxID=3415126 RepID=UPI003C7D1A5F